MLVSELFEDRNHKTIAVLAGRFQPWHLGHKYGYDFLANKFGTNNTFVVTSDRTELPKSPFNFEQKRRFIAATGVPTNNIIKSTSPYRAAELVQDFDPANTILVFGVSAKDMAEDPRFSFAPKRDGSPSYFQPYDQNFGKLKTLDQHGYIITVPTMNFTVLNRNIKSASEIRQMYTAANEKQRKQIIIELFGKYTAALKQTMDQGLSQ